jgi:hypothetical protein
MTMQRAIETKEPEGAGQFTQQHESDCLAVYVHVHDDAAVGRETCHWEVVEHHPDQRGDCGTALVVSAPAK